MRDGLSDYLPFRRRRSAAPVSAACCALASGHTRLSASILEGVLLRPEPGAATDALVLRLLQDAYGTLGDSVAMRGSVSRVFQVRSHMRAYLTVMAQHDTSFHAGVGPEHAALRERRRHALVGAHTGGRAGPCRGARHDCPEHGPAGGRGRAAGATLQPRTDHCRIAGGLGSAELRRGVHARGPRSRGPAAAARDERESFAAVLRRPPPLHPPRCCRTDGRARRGSSTGCSGTGRCCSSRRGTCGARWRATTACSSP